MRAAFVVLVVVVVVAGPSRANKDAETPTMPASAASPALPAPTTSEPPAGPPVPTAAPAAPAVLSRLKTIVLDVKGPKATREELDVLSGLAAAALSEFGTLEVLSGADVRGIATLEAEKQSLGCEESATCLAELAGALGAQLVVFGEVHRLGAVAILNLTMFDTRTQQSVGRVALQGASLEEIVAALPDAVAGMVVPFLARAGLPTTRVIARRVAPRLLPTATVAADGFHGWGTLGAVSAGLLLVGHAAVATLMATINVPGELPDAMAPPVVGPFLASGVAGRLQAKYGGTVVGEPMSIVYFAQGVVEVALASAGVVGGVGWAEERIADGPALDGAGNAWRWGLVGGGVVALSGAIAIDALSPTSRNHAFDAVDLASPALYAVGAAAPIVGLAINPFAPTAVAE